MENTAENTLLIPFSKLPKKELSKDQGQTLIRIMGMSEEIAEKTYTDLLKSPNSWIPTAVDKRVHLILNLDVCPKTRLYILYVTAGGGFSYPLTMYYYLKLWAKKNKAKRITFEMFCLNIFPSGFPDLKDVQELWDKSKIEGTPVLDIGKYCLSII